MSKGSKRAYKVVPVEDDEPSFGDPPRKWSRVTAMSAVWAVVLLGGAWMAPGFAAGGSEEETDARDQAATDEINAASRYLRFGSDGNSDRVQEILCDGADPDVTVQDLVDLRTAYEEELGSYPEVEVETKEPIGSAEGFEVRATVSYIAGNAIRDEQFTITILSSGGDYCVTEAVWDSAEDQGDQSGSIDLDILRFIVFDRDLESAGAIQCADYSGPSPEELLDAIDAWESEHGSGGLSYAAPTGAEPQTSPGTVAAFPYEVVLGGDENDETFNFTVTVSDDCVSAVSGGEELLAYM